VTAIEVVRTDEEHDRDRNRQSVKDAQLLNRFDLQQQMPAPTHVRRQRREQIDERDRRCTDGSEERERVCTPEATQREWVAMKSQPPRSGVTASRCEITPVLRDQPQPGGCRETRRERVVHVPGGRP